MADLCGAAMAQQQPAPDDLRARGETPGGGGPKFARRDDLGFRQLPSVIHIGGGAQNRELRTITNHPRKFAVKFRRYGSATAD